MVQLRGMVESGRGVSRGGRGMVEVVEGGPFSPWTRTPPNAHCTLHTTQPQPTCSRGALLRAFAAESPPHSTAFGRQSCGTEGTRVAISDLAAAARQASAARPMRAHVPSSDRAPRPGWARDAHRKKPSRTDGERSGASRSLSDRAARRRTCADARTSSCNPAPRLAAIRPS